MSNKKFVFLYYELFSSFGVKKRDKIDYEKQPRLYARSPAIIFVSKIKIPFNIVLIVLIG